MIKAITFDLWVTLVHDDSDEPKRQALNLRSKYEERRHRLWQAIEETTPATPIDRELLWRAYDVADAAFGSVWHDLHITWPIRKRLEIVLEGLKITLPDETLAKVVYDHERMEVDIPPDKVEGVEQALAMLAKRYKLAIASDAIVTPGSALRELLEKHGLRRYFTAFAFSDEVGRSKPHRAMFEHAAREMGVALHEMVHIGDREHNDVQGPLAQGMKAILFTGAKDRGSARTRAQAVCHRFADLPAAMEKLAGTQDE